MTENKLILHAELTKGEILAYEKRREPICVFCKNKCKRRTIHDKYWKLQGHYEDDETIDIINICDMCNEKYEYIMDSPSDYIIVLKDGVKYTPDHYYRDSD